MTRAAAWRRIATQNETWLPALLFAAFAGYLLFAQSALLWHAVLPFGDQAADDLLILDAKRFRLLHGNYSRFGFYHPGPWFLFVSAMGEYVFRDWTGLFRSSLGAQSYALGLTQSAAVASCCRLWLLTTRRASYALLCTAVVLASMLAPLAPVNPLIRAWIPYATAAASLYAATGLAGVILRGASWLPLLVFGAAQTMHGHASLLGLVPTMLAVAVLVLACADRQPVSAARLAGWLSQNRLVVLCSLGIAAIFAAPIMADVILHWPGQFVLYWRFLGSLPPLPAWTALRYEVGFVPAAGAWLTLLLLPSKQAERPREVGRLRLAGLVLFVASAIPGFLYSWHGVDDPAHRYLLLWLTPFMGMSLAACLVYALNALPWPAARVVPGLAVGVAALTVISSVNPALTSGETASPALQRAVQLWLSRPPPSDDGRIELTLDRSATAWGPAWSETVTVLAALKRAGRRDLCVAAITWHLLFGEENRCDFLHDLIIARDRVTLWANINTPAIRLDASGLAAMPDVTTGPARCRGRRKRAEHRARLVRFGRRGRLDRRGHGLSRLFSRRAAGPFHPDADRQAVGTGRRTAERRPVR